LTKKPTHKATVVCCRYDPLSGRVLASAGLDGNVNLTSNCALPADKNENNGPWASVDDNGTNLMTFHSNGWINYIAFSPSATQLCYVTHDCELNFADVSKGKESSDKDKLKTFHHGNPHLNCIYVSEDTLVACGYDKVPYIYKKTANEWKETSMLDAGVKKEVAFKPSKLTGDKKIFFNDTFVDQSKKLEITEK
jgi:WD40 repeat protein